MGYFVLADLWSFPLAFLLWKLKFHRLVYFPKHAIDSGESDWQWSAVLIGKKRSLGLKSLGWSKCISGRGCLSAAGGGKEMMLDGGKREKTKKGGWIHELGHNEAHQARWPLSHVTSYGSPFPSKAWQVRRAPIQNPFALSVTDPRKCRSRKWEKEIKRANKE